MHTAEYGPSNYYQGLLQLKNQLSGSISKQQDVILQMNEVQDGNSDIWPSIPAMSFSSASDGLIYSIGEIDANDERLVEIFDANTHQLIASHNFTMEEFTEDIPLPGTDTYPSDIILAINNNSQVNSLYSDINDLFLTKTNVDVTLIREVADKYRSSIPNDVTTMLSNLSLNASDDNKISQYAFIQITRTQFEYGQKAGSDERFSLDDTNPYVVVDFMNVILNTVVSVVSTIFVTVLTICNKFLGILAAVMASLVQLYLKAEEIYGALTVDENQPVWHIAGAVRTGKMICQGIRFDEHHPEWDNLIVKSRLPGCEKYTWLTGQSDLPGYSKTTENSQIFVTLNVHPDRFMTYVAYCITVQTWGSSMRYVINHPSFMHENDDPTEDPTLDYHIQHMWLTTEEYEKLSLDGEFLRRTIAANIMAYCLCHLMAYGQFAIENALSAWPFTEASYQGKGLSMPAAIGALSISELAKHHANESYAYFGDWTLERISDLHHHLFLETPTISEWYGLGSDDVLPTITGGNVTAAFGRPNAFYNENQYTYLRSGWPDTCQLANVDNIDQEVLDYYPVSPKVTLPALDFAALRRALIITGVAVTATMVAFKVTKAIIKKKTYFNRITAANDLQQAYDQAVATGSDADRKVFFKKNRRFKLKAKIFGWDNYDPVNAWWDPKDSGAAIISNSQVNTTNTDRSLRNIKSLIAG